jgi:hypothetical protein
MVSFMLKRDTRLSFHSFARPLHRLGRVRQRYLLKRAVKRAKNARFTHPNGSFISALLIETADTTGCSGNVT